MFKKGDIVVKTYTTNTTNRVGSKKDDIWKINKLTSFIKDSAYYPDGKSHSNKVRKATDNEIKWFEAGITNINQIPEVGGTFCTERIESINYSLKYSIKTNAGTYSLKYWLETYLQRYKPPVESQYVGNEVPIDTLFEPGDLKNCKIGNLTPEDHKIIQPWLNSLGYGGKIMSDRKILYINGICQYSLTTSDESYFKKQPFVEIKKELILNYIKQLNTNNNYEQINKKREIKPESRTIRGASIRIPVITGRIASASRLIGNKASGKCVKSQIRKFEIVANIITC